MRSSRNVTALFGQGYRNFLNLLYPRRCPLCHRILRNSHQLICPDCAGDLRPVSGPRCYKCGKPVNGDEMCIRDRKNLSVDIPRDKFVVLTGLSGSGKSSLAFDTIYAEGQRRYMESLSSYARQFLGQMEKPRCV